MVLCLDTGIIPDKENQLVGLEKWYSIPLMRGVRPGKKVEKSVARLSVTA
jgi:hypothetical protein